MNNDIVNPPFISYPIALSFNGTNSYVNIGNPDLLNFTGKITIQAWILPKSRDEFRNIIAHGYTSSPNAEVFLRIMNGKYRFGSWDGTEHFVELEMQENDLNKWVHLCAVYDGTSWILYRNGDRRAIHPDPVGALRVNDNWCIGSTGDGKSRFFNGLIRNVAVWKSARDARQVQLDMYSIQPFKETDLVGYWPLDFGKGIDIVDHSDFQHHGVASNTGWYHPSIVYPNTLVCPGEPKNGYVDIGMPKKIETPGPLTLSVWIMLHKTDGIRNVIAIGSKDEQRDIIYIRVNNGKYQIGSYYDKEYSAELAVPEEDILKWVHLSGVYDGTNWLLYRNGKLEAESPGVKRDFLHDASWVVGAACDGRSKFIASCVKEFSVWSVPFNGNEILELIHSGVDSHKYGLEAHWPMTEGADSVIFDRTLNPCNGELKEAGWITMPDFPNLTTKISIRGGKAEYQIDVLRPDGAAYIENQKTPFDLVIPISLRYINVRIKRAGSILGQTSFTIPDKATEIIIRINPLITGAMTSHYADSKGVFRFCEGIRFQDVVPIITGISWGADITTAGNLLYAIHNDRLYSVIPDVGKPTEISAGWNSNTQLTSINNQLYAIYNNKLWKVDIETGTRIELAAKWRWHKDIVSINWQLYTVYENKLWEVNPESGDSTQIGQDSWGWNGMSSHVRLAGLNGKLYVAFNERLYEILEDGTRVEKASGWRDLMDITSFGKFLYAVYNSQLYQINPDDGKSILWRKSYSESINRITVFKGRMYILTGSQIISYADLIDDSEEGLDRP